MAVDSIAGQAIITHKQGLVSVIDLITFATLTTINVMKKPVSVVVDPGLRVAVVAHEIDEDDDGQDGRDDRSSHDKHDSVAHRHGHKRNDDNITIIDLNTLSVAKTLHAGKAPVKIAINASTHQAAVANEKSDTVTMVDLTTRLVTGTYSVQKNPKALAFNDCLNTLSVIGGEDKAWLQVLDGSTGAIQASFGLPKKQKDVLLSSSLNQAYLAGRNGLTIQDLPNPVPELASLSPNKAVRGGPSFSVTVEGKGLMGTTELYLNGNKTEPASASCNSITGAWYYGGYSGDGGPAIQARLNQPSGVAVDSSGNIYIADAGNHRIRKVNTSGIITTVAGNGQAGYGGDGMPADQSSLYRPEGVALDSADNLFIADMHNHRIRKVDSRGIITTAAGSDLTPQYGGFSGDGGPAMQASLAYPRAVAVGAKGRMYIADTENYRIRQILLPSEYYSYITAEEVPFFEDNGLGQIMSGTGLHKSTIDLASGKALRTFGYNANDQLISIADRFGNQSTVQRDAAGKPTTITSADGLVTSLAIDSNNHLTQIGYPDGSFYSLSYRGPHDKGIRSERQPVCP